MSEEKNYRTSTLYMTDQAWDDLRFLCEEKGVTQSALMRNLLSQARKEIEWEADTIRIHVEALAKLVL